MNLSTNRIYNMDSVNVGLKLLQTGSVDLVVTDPPFGIEFEAKKANYNRNDENVLEGYEEAEEDYYEWTMKWLKECTRVLKDDGAMYIFSGWNNLKDILCAIDDCGLETINHIIWKYQFGVYTSRKFVSSHYHCLYVAKPKAKRFFDNEARFSAGDTNEDGTKKRYKDMEDVWVINREYWPNSIKTPTRLPLELVDKCLAYSSEKGDLILDPFMGSGQVAWAAKQSERQYVGFEKVPTYCNFANRRLELNRYLLKEEDL